MNTPAKRCPMGVSNQTLLDDLKRVYAICGELSIPIYIKHGQYSASTFTRKFDGWNKALKKAGLPLNYRRGEGEMTDSQMQPFEPIVKPSRHKCPVCLKFHVAINYTCPKCQQSRERFNIAESWERVAG
jgi:hypothetical protein